MRIEAYSQIQQLYNQKNVKKVEETKKTRSFKDQLQLSAAGMDMQVAKNAIQESPDVRTELVKSIKERIDSGTYDVDIDDFAEKLLNGNNLF